jgi:hypothetical protein
MSRRTLFRPVGLKALKLIIESGWRRFPLRLQWQPVFYPVLNQQYAGQIALEWNTNDAFSGYCGIVTRFELDEAFLAKYPVQHVGGSGHDELWIPAGELAAFNDHIIDGIHVTNVFFGDRFVMPDDKGTADALKKFIQ